MPVEDGDDRGDEVGVHRGPVVEVGGVQAGRLRSHVGIAAEGPQGADQRRPEASRAVVLAGPIGAGVIIRLP